MTSRPSSTCPPVRHRPFATICQYFSEQSWAPTLHASSHVKHMSPLQWLTSHDARPFFAPATSGLTQAVRHLSGGSVHLRPAEGRQQHVRGRLQQAGARDMEHHKRPRHGVALLAIIHILHVYIWQKLAQQNLRCVPDWRVQPLCMWLTRLFPNCCRSHRSASFEVRQCCAK